METDFFKVLTGTPSIKSPIISGVSFVHSCLKFAISAEYLKANNVNLVHITQKKLSDYLNLWRYNASQDE